MLRDPEVALCHTDLAVVDAHGKQLHPSCFLLERRNLDDYSLPQLILRNSVTGSTLAMRATLLPRLLPFPFQGPSPRFYHDHWTALHATLVGRIVAIREPLVHYRQHDGNQLGAAPARSAWRVASQQGSALLCRHPHLHLWSVEREWTLRQEWIKLLLKRAPSTPRSGARLDALAGWLQRRLGLVQLCRFLARHNRPARAELARSIAASRRIIGIGDSLHFDFKNIQFNRVPHLAIVQAIERAIVQFEPAWVFTHHPADLNIDHRVSVPRPGWSWPRRSRSCAM